MAAKVVSSEEKKSINTPTEIGTIINEQLMKRPNKGTVFKSFIKSIKEPRTFIFYFLEHYHHVNAGFWNEVKVLCTKKIDAGRAIEIKETEEKIAALTRKLENLKK